MTNQQHPITPPEDLLQQLRRNTDTWLDQIIIAYQAGADQELEACCEWLGDAPVVYNDNDDLHPGSYLRDARRPKPPTLKEQALQMLASAPGPDYPRVMTVLNADEHALIRQALEALSND